MLTVYDLYDLHAIIIGIRSFPENKLNLEIVLKITEVLMNRHFSNDSNQFRMALRKTSISKDDELFRFIFVDNMYSYYPLSFLKDENIYLILLQSCDEMKKSLNDCNYEKLYDIADCLHNLPIMLVENHYCIYKKYWNNEVKNYRMKWNKEFLLDEEKIFNSHAHIMRKLRNVLK